MQLPPPFPGASRLLIDSHAAVTGKEMPTEPQAELNYRMAVDGYLRLYLREARQHYDHWSRIGAKSPAGSPERTEALRTAETFMDLIRGPSPHGDNYAAIKRLHEMLRAAKRR